MTPDSSNFTCPIIQQILSIVDQNISNLFLKEYFPQNHLYVLYSIILLPWMVCTQELNQSLIHAWNEDQRVKSLKIAIQCSKLLSDVNVIQFYPSKFVLVTDILDTFGNLVFDRIAEKAISNVKGSRHFTLDNLTPDQVRTKLVSINYTIDVVFTAQRNVLMRQNYVENLVSQSFRKKRKQENMNFLKLSNEKNEEK